MHSKPGGRWISTVYTSQVRTFNITARYIHANFLLNVACKKKQIAYVGLWDMHVHTSKIVQSYTQKLFA